MSKIKEIRKDLEMLIDRGNQLQFGLLLEECYKEEEAGIRKTMKKMKIEPQEFNHNYEQWYSEALEVVRQLLPNRLGDFERLYKGDGKRKETNHLTYTISDKIIGLVTKFGGEIKTDGRAAIPKFQQQLTILAAAAARLDSGLFDIRHILQADLFDSELNAARELLKNGFTRPAGALAGVVLESHLKETCLSHKVVLAKKDPSISEYNDALKVAQVIEVPFWRSIQHLCDLRNLCDHKKDRDPTKEDVTKLIEGVEEVVKKLF